MPNTRRFFTSALLILISAVSCAAAWLLYNTNFIPVIDTLILLLSVGLLVWGVRTIYKAEAVASPLRSALIRNSRKLIHSLWLISAVLLNVVVGLIWYFTLPEFDTSHNGQWYYAYHRAGWETDEAQVEVRVRNGLQQEYLTRVFVGQPCRSNECYLQAIKQADQLRMNKKP